MSVWFHVQIRRMARIKVNLDSSLSHVPVMTVGHKCQERTADVTPHQVRHLYRRPHFVLWGVFFLIFQMLLSTGSAERGSSRGTKGSLLLHFVYHCVRKGADRRQ